MRSDNEILFIICVSDRNKYDVCVRHLNRLVIPEGFNVKLNPILGARNIAEA